MTDRPRTNRPFSGGWAALVWTAGYVVTSGVLLFPVLRTPIVADDLVNPFQQAAERGPGVWNGIMYGWEGATTGASFRILGNTVGGAVNSWWLGASASTGLRVEYLYALSKLTVLILCALSVTLYVVEAARALGQALRFRPTLVAFSLALFLTLQIHAFWSNDPVVSYPLSGFGSAAVGFAAMAAIAAMLRRRTISSALITAVAGVGAVLYYELNVGALIGSGVLILTLLARSRRDRPAALRITLLTTIAAAAPAGALLLGRFVTGGQASTYAGTTTRVGGEAARTFVEGMLSSLPGAAWKLSDRFVTGGRSPGWWGFVCAVVTIAALTVSHRLDPMGPSEPEGPEPFDAVLAPRDAATAWSLVVIVVSMTVYWACAVAIQAITVKVQDESHGIGYVYTASAIGCCVVAAAIAGLGEYARHHAIKPLRAVMAAAALVFVVLQGSVNWRLSELMDRTFIKNSELLASFDDDIGVADRCERLQTWAEGAWPDYYEVAMIDGLEVTYEHYFGESFCPGFVRPPDP